MRVPARINPKWRVAAAALSALVLGALLVAPAARNHARALYVLQKLAHPQARSAVEFVAYPVEESAIRFAGPRGSVRARLFAPRGVARPPGMVVVHGVHFDGIDDPRLIAFARSVAATGIAVLTPELRGLAEFRVEPEAVAEIGAAAQELARRLGKKVGVGALSFAGGLALLAATDPQYAPSIAFVLAVGAHSSMARVARFYATNQDPLPGGGVQRMRAHPYGAMLLLYSYPEELFSPAEAPVVREALWLALHEQEAAARATAEKLSPASRAQLEALAVRWDTAPLRAGLLRSIERHRPEMDAVSPEGKLASLRVPVYLLHGEGDDVIPSAETRWLEREVPRGLLRKVLVSPAVAHVDMNQPTRADQWRLVRFLAAVISASQ